MTPRENSRWELWKWWIDDIKELLVDHNVNLLGDDDDPFPIFMLTLLLSFVIWMFAILLCLAALGVVVALVVSVWGVLLGG